MKRFYKFLCAAFLLPSFCYAQSNFKTGYVVDIKGDTLQGFIDYKEWDKNPRDIRFKKNNTDNTVNYSTENSVAFDVAGFEHYEAYKVLISLSQVDVEKLSTGPDTSATTMKIFLKAITNGPNVILYEYKDDIKTRFYIKERQSAIPEELIYRSYLNPDNVNQIITQPRYQNQLQQLAIKYGRSNEKLTSKIKITAYHGSELISIVNSINGSARQGSVTAKTSPLRFFAGAGISESNLSYSGDIALALDATSKASYGPRLDFGIDAFLNPNVGRLLLRAEVSFSTASLKVSSNSGAKASQSYKQFLTTLTPQLIYNIYNTDNAKIYFGAGVSINLAANSNNSYYYAQEPFSGTKVEIKDFPNLTSNYISFMLRAGVVLDKKYELFAIYVPAAEVTDHYTSFSGSVTTVQAGINYLFGKTH